jgi:hypothetical protein
LKIDLKFNDADNDGFVWSSHNINDMMHEILLDIFHEDRNLFPISISNIDDIHTHYHCYRTFRRTSSTRALNMKVKATDVDTVNRWRIKDKENQDQRNIIIQILTSY